MTQIRKVNKDWYRITVTQDKWGLVVDVVDILRNSQGDWSVCDDDVSDKIGRRANDVNRIVFSKLRAAKEFARDVVLSIQNETPYPRICDEKYLELDWSKTR